MVNRQWFVLAIWIFWLQNVFGQQTQVHLVHKSYSLTLTPLPGITIDGNLDESGWQTASSISTFTNYEPTPGLPLSIPIVVKVAYTNDGLYIGMHATEHQANIFRELSLRDDSQNTDLFGILIDAYGTGSSGYGFAVTPQNVQLDKIQQGEDDDSRWDAVWVSATQVMDDGWSAEMYIPYSALRFSTKDVQRWKFNIYYNKRNTRESATWFPLDVTQDNPLNQMGEIIIPSRIDPPLRLFLYPYAGLYFKPTNSKKLQATAGMDLKLGLSEAYTLDMTIIPDFGQVRFDDEILNVSSFELKYDENRPFFTEGTDLFEKSGNFYSRRIGASIYTQFPDSSKLIVSKIPDHKLYNAFKISGRNSHGLAIGLLNAIEGKRSVKVRDLQTNEESNFDLSPLTNNNILVLDQVLKNNSSLTFSNFNTFRRGAARDANVTSLGTYLRDKSQQWYIAASGNLSYIHNIDSNTPGSSFLVSLGKNAGKYQYSLAYGEISKNYDPRDLGYLAEYNVRNLSVSLKIVDAKPRERLSKIVSNASLVYSGYIDPGGFRSLGINMENFTLFKNFFAIISNASIYPLKTADQFSYLGPINFNDTPLNIPAYFSVNSGISSDYRKIFAADAFVTYVKWMEPGRMQYELSFRPKLRINDYLAINLEMNWTQFYKDVGFLITSDDLPSGYQYKPLYSIRSGKIMILEFEPQLKINNNLNVTLEARNYWQSQTIVSVHSLGTDGNLGPVISELAHLRGPQSQFINWQAVVNWRYAPGSDMSFVWARSGSIYTSDVINAGTSLSNFFIGRLQNVFSVRLNYFIDVNRFRKH